MLPNSVAQLPENKRENLEGEYRDYRDSLQLSTAFVGSINMPFLILGAVQYPAYGAIPGIAIRAGRMVLALAIVCAIHVVVAILSLALPNESF